ncbi:LamB/YcsF family protein [Brumimicrobium salinarum]|nr:LamB/YcsF family protein [Brumimicrobium salinarum]
MEININADLGEMAGQDEAIMPYLFSCNIATGGHIGDEESMRKTIELANEHRVKIGAHPSYPDTNNFGRVRPEISDSALKESLKKQLYNFYELAAKIEVEIHHIKPHGALYHDVANDKNKAALFLTILDELGLKTSIYTLKDGFLNEFGQKEHKIYFEAFIDRRYKDDLNLVNRKESHALINEAKRVWEQLESMYYHEKVKVETGNFVPLKADTYCLHGDHPNALEILQYIYRKVNQNK